MPSLDGTRIVVTRAAHQAEELAAPLRDLGAEVLLIPTIAIAPPADPLPLRTAAEGCRDYDWIIFTSTNAVSAFAAELQNPSECTTQIAAIGSATAHAAEQHGFHVTATPEDYISESIVALFHGVDLNGKSFLIPSAKITRDVVPAELRKRGAHVDVVEAYQNVLPVYAQQLAETAFQTPLPDWVTFASSSAVINLLTVIDAERVRPVKIATIGPVTSNTVRKYGLEVAAEASTSTVSALVEALVNAAAKRPA